MAVFIDGECHRHLGIILVFPSSGCDMSFDFHCKHALFTYAQCGSLDPWAVSDHFSALGAECIIGREAHADGGTHLHAFVSWERRFRSRRSTFADVLGCHPNISRSRGTPWDGYDYATKDGDVVAGGLERPERPADSVRGRDEAWSKIVAAETREKFWELVRELAPSDLAKSFPSLAKFCDWQYASTPGPYDGPVRGDTRFDTSAYPELEAWCSRLDSEVDGSRGMYAASSITAAPREAAIARA